LGTNPSSSRLVILKSPKIKALVKKGFLSKTVSEAMERGMFSRIMQSNARMCFRALLPILNWDMYRLDVPGLSENETADRLRARLLGIETFIMDYALRSFVQSNSVGNVLPAHRAALLERAFVYHLVTEMEKTEIQNLQIKHILKKELAHVKTWEAWKALETRPSELFERGFVSKSGTSNALKYMSCFGLTCALYPAFSDDFEDIVSVHYHRSMEVQGFTTKRHILSHRWPPKSDKSDKKIDAAAISELRDKLLLQEGKLKLGLTDLGDKACVVFQRKAPALGGHILALVLSNNKYRVDCIQCKNFVSSPGPADVLKLWRSLGIEMNENNEWDLEPTTGAAGYSYASLKVFCELLGNQLGGIPVDIGQRVIATSLKVPPMAEFPIPTGKDGTPIVNVSVWFREMLEPTISVLSVSDELEVPRLAPSQT
jgi:hypothetical protein